jgi:hypothetical protein
VDCVTVCIVDVLVYFVMVNKKKTNRIDVLLHVRSVCVVMFVFVSGGFMSASGVSRWGGRWAG